MPDLQKLNEAIKIGNRDEAKALTQEAIDAKLPPQDVLDAMVTAMDDVGATSAAPCVNRKSLSAASAPPLPSSMVVARVFVG